MAVVCADRNDGRLTAQCRVALPDPVGAIHPNEERERAQSLLVGRASPFKAQPVVHTLPSHIRGKSRKMLLELAKGLTPYGVECGNSPSGSCEFHVSSAQKKLY
jgi:hypothetical protein